LKEGDYRRILEARIPLECLAIARAARNMTNEVQQQLTSLVVKMGTAADAGDFKSFHENDVAFHRKIWELAENPYLKGLLEAVAFRLFVFSVVGPRADKHNANLASVQQHLGILAGLTTRDPAQARLAFLHHTLKYWNEHYKLDLTMEDLETVPVVHS
jgi:DNA-binding GntR family transcriptional regulator